MKLKLCNVHKMALANEGEERKPIFIPFGTWDYDEAITQTLDKPHAEGIAAALEKQIAAGEPGIPVYQGHPDVPEYAGKYPDKGAMGWVKKILVNEDGMFCHVEWDRDPGKGFGWFSPYWIGEPASAGGSGAPGKKNVIIDGLTSIGLVNNPNIREFRLANECGEDLTQRGRGAEVTEFKLPERLVALAKRRDDRVSLANVTDANGMEHVEAGTPEGGQFMPKTNEATVERLTKLHTKFHAHGKNFNTSAVNLALSEARKTYGKAGNTHNRRLIASEIQAIHKTAIQQGYEYDPKTHKYLGLPQYRASLVETEIPKNPPSWDWKYRSRVAEGQKALAHAKANPDKYRIEEVKSIFTGKAEPGRYRILEKIGYQR